jgi:hypothetical protein
LEAALDFSLGSLKRIDDYLLRLHKALPKKLFRPRDPAAMGTEELAGCVLGAGCYLGEVIRRAPNGEKYTWRTHAELSREYPAFGTMYGTDPDLLTQLALWEPAGQIWMPLNKIYKFLADGPDDATAPFAAVVLK